MPVIALGKPWTAAVGRYSGLHVAEPGKGGKDFRPVGLGAAHDQEARCLIGYVA